MAELKISMARGAFLAVFEPKKFADSDEGKPSYSSSLLLAKEDPQIKFINAKIDEVAKEKWQEKSAGILKTMRASDRTCLHDGDMKEQYEGFPGHYFIAARNQSRPLVIDRDKTPLTEKDGRPYSGCYVNAILDIWAMDNKYGKRVNATLKGIQFVKDGDAFSGSAPASVDAFDDLSDGADAGGLA